MVIEPDMKALFQKTLQQFFCRHNGLCHQHKPFLYAFYADCLKADCSYAELPF